jgi:hypothetical protein
VKRQLFPFPLDFGAVAPGAVIATVTTTQLNVTRLSSSNVAAMSIAPSAVGR